MRARLPPVLALLAVVPAAGCREECGEWADVPVEDPDGLATPEEVDAVRAAIDLFAVWTGRDETCVEEVRFVDALEQNGVPLAGVYASPSRRIRVVADLSQGALATVMAHEFCHALDHEEGWVSLENAEILAPHTEGLDPVVYDTEDARTRDAFARICQEGPALPALYAALSEACGVEAEDAAVAFVDEVAFAPREGAGDLGTFSAEATWTALEETGRVATPLGAWVAPGAAGLFALDHSYTEEGDGTVTIAPELLRVDPATRTVVERLALDPHAPARDANNNPVYSRHRLLGSGGDPILVSLEDGAAWRVRSEPLALEAIAFPAFDPWTELTGFEHDGRALVMGTRDGVDLVALVDLDAGTVATVAEGEADLFDATRPVALYADAEGGLAVFAGGGGPVLVGLDGEGEVAWLQALPGGDDRVKGLTRLADGSVLVAPTVYVPEGDHASGVPLPMRLDPASRAWSVPAGDCGGIWTSGGWVLAEGVPATVSTETLDTGGYRLTWGELTVTTR